MAKLLQEKSQGYSVYSKEAQKKADNTPKPVIYGSKNKNMYLGP